MLVGIGIGYAFPNAPALIQRFDVGTTNVPLAIGPLVEVPALLALVHAAFALGKRLYNSDAKRASLIA
ncbi:MAG TPA: hypothetical protein VFS24_07015 [Steroidobacteraceae bacterium]|nr:hypothetical protein [Steroidobacteraceae bacterium]